MVKIGRPRKSLTGEKPRTKSPLPPPPPPTGVRAGGRIKKAKVVFDPSDNYLPKKFKKDNQNDSRKNDSDPSSPETSSSSSSSRSQKFKEEAKRKEPEEQCSICTKYEATRLKLLIFCLDCNDRVHPKCLKINYKDFNTLKERYRCAECSSCVKCYEGKEEGQLITCKYCIHSYHLKCHVPEVTKKSVDINGWTCFKCSTKRENKKRSRSNLLIDTNNTDDSISVSSQSSSIVSKQERIDDGYVDSSKSTSPQIQSKKKPLSRAAPLPKLLPSTSEIQSWNTREVHDYFEPYFPDESKFISKNEIDGQALLLMTREDIIRKDSPWKLGGLLKFYNIITKIQNNTKSNACAWS